MSNDIFTFGKCIICNKEKALKNGVCKECTDKQSNFMDLFCGIVRGDNDVK